MTDLMQRLRTPWTKPAHTPPEFAEAANHIEKLERENETNERNLCILTDDLAASRRENAELRKDAERYRWLEREHMRDDPVCHLTWKRNSNRAGSEWVNTARLDAAIDEAMKS